MRFYTSKYRLYIFIYCAKLRFGKIHECGTFGKNKIHYSVTMNLLNKLVNSYIMTRSLSYLCCFIIDYAAKKQRTVFRLTSGSIYLTLWLFEVFKLCNFWCCSLAIEQKLWDKCFVDRNVFNICFTRCWKSLGNISQVSSTFYCLYKSVSCCVSFTKLTINSETRTMVSI